MPDCYEIRLDERQELDEVVAKVGGATVHLERMEPTVWCLIIGSPDPKGHDVHLHFEARWLVVERDGGGHVPIRGLTPSGERTLRCGPSSRRWASTWLDRLEQRLADLDETRLRPIVRVLLSLVERFNA